MPKKKHPGFVYILHFSRKFSHASHYVGWAKDVDKRFQEHKAGMGARLTQVVVESGIELTLASVFVGTRDDERKLKNKKCTPRLCPICRGIR